MKKDLIEKLENALFAIKEVIDHPQYRGLIGAYNARRLSEGDLNRVESGNVPRMAGAFQCDSDGKITDLSGK